MLMFMAIAILVFNAPMVRAEEPILTDILNALGFSNTAEIQVETFISGTYNITLYAEFADYNAQNELSWYPVNTSDFNLIFSGSDGNFGYVNPPLSKIFNITTKFGLSFLSPEARYYTETSRNPDDIKHAKVYVNLDNPDIYLIGFENKLGQTSDRDYNDMVMSVELITPPTLNVNNTNWLMYNATNSKAMIYLDGGGASSLGSVNVFPYLQDKKPPESLFIHKMVWSGFDVITNADGFYYNGSQTAVKDVAQWLLAHSYEHIFLFGYSAGGIITAYEIQKEYASTLFSAAVVASAPIDWDSFSTAPIFQSAHTASKDKVATCFIAGVNDTIGNPSIPVQMMTYYNNTLTTKNGITGLMDMTCFTIHVTTIPELLVISSKYNSSQ
jgi:hypothetical protein